MNDEQREGLGEALVDSLVEVWQSDDTVVIHADQIDPAIDAIAEYLWQRADDPEVVEAVAKAEWDFNIPDGCPEWELAGQDQQGIYLGFARAALNAGLEALLGPRPSGEESEHGQ